MVANIAGNMYGLYPNIYNNQIAMNDLSGYDMYFSSGMCMDPMLSMNGSIFGSYNPMMNPTMSPMMPGMMPSFTGNYEDYYKQYEKYQDFVIDNQVRQQQKWRNADLKLHAPEEGIQSRVAALQDKIVRNEQDQIKQAYESLVDGVRSLYGDASREELVNRANSLYKSVTQKTIVEDVREHGKDSFTQGLLQTVTFGLFNRNTAEDTVSKLTGQPVGSEEKAKKVTGNVVGGAIVGGSIFGLSSLACKTLKITAKSKTFWGIIAGGIAGTIAAVCGSK